MQIIDKDDSRMIDLPGVGPCPRPVDIDQSVTGFETLKSLRIYRFEPGPAIEGESEVDEVFVIPVSGTLSMTITGASPCASALSSEPLQALYMAPEHMYNLAPSSAVEVAYARAEAAGAVPSQSVSGAESQGLAEALSYKVMRLAAGEALTLDMPGEVLAYLAEGAARSEAGDMTAGQTLALASGESATLTATQGARLLILAA